MSSTVFNVTQFEERLGDTFRVIDERVSALELKVASVTDLGEHDPNRPAELPPPFTVVFHGPREPFLPQGVWRLEHDSTGPLDIFIVPIGPAEDAMQYEAAFG